MGKGLYAISIIRAYWWSELLWESVGGSDKVCDIFSRILIQVLVQMVTLLPGWKVPGWGFVAADSHIL